LSITNPVTTSTASAIAAETPVIATPAEVTDKKLSEVLSFLTDTTLDLISIPLPAVYISTKPLTLTYTI
jgi:hypothetical protein